jgi:hypothetical protein
MKAKAAAAPAKLRAAWTPEAALVVASGSLEVVALVPAVGMGTVPLAWTPVL